MPTKSQKNQGSADSKNPRFFAKDHDRSYSSYVGGSNEFPPNKRPKFTLTPISILIYIGIALFIGIIATPILNFFVFPLLVVAGVIFLLALGASNNN